MLNYQRVTCWKFNFDLGFRMGIFHEDEWKLPVGVWQLAESSYPIGSMVLPYMVTFTTFTINIPQMLAYIPAPWILWVWKIPVDWGNSRTGGRKSWETQLAFSD